MSRPLDLEAQSLRELQEERSNLLSLTQHPGYKWLLSLVDGQIKARQAQINGPLDDILGILRQEYLKGEVSGITTFREIVPTTIELIDSFIKEKVEESENAKASVDGD